MRKHKIKSQTELDRHGPRSQVLIFLKIQYGISYPDLMNPESDPDFFAEYKSRSSFFREKIVNLENLKIFKFLW